MGSDLPKDFKRHEDMPGIDPWLVVHRLNVNLASRLVKQKKRKFALEKNQVITEEVEKLLKNCFVRKVHYPDWLVNVVMVRKPNGKWHMCVNFTDLNSMP